MQSWKEYSNAKLSDDGIYSQKNINHDGMYFTNNSSSEDETFVQKAMKIAGLGTAAYGVGKAVYTSGTMSAYVHKFMVDFAEMKGLQYYSDASEAIKMITENKSRNTGMFQDIADIVHNQVIQENILKNESERAQKRTLLNLDTINRLIEKNSLIDILSQDKTMQPNTTIKLINELNKNFNAYGVEDIAESVSMLNSTQMRHATIGDLINNNKLTDYAKNIVGEEAKLTPDLLSRVADKNVLIDMDGNIIDFRDSIKSFKKIMFDSMNDFQIPVLGINPFKMFQVDSLFREDKKPLYHIFKGGEIQPTIMHNTSKLTDKHLLIGDSLFNLRTGGLVEKGISLADANHGFYAVNMSRMSGIKFIEKEQRWKGPVGKAAFDIAKVFDFGMQDEVYRQDFHLFEPATWLTSVADKVYNVINPSKDTPIDGADIKKAYGKDTKYIAMRDSKKFGEEGFVNQFFAGRKNLDEVTKASAVPYMLMERINSALGAFKLGLSREHIGSAGDVFVNLMGKRILPVVAAIGAITYIDSLTERKDGTSLKDDMADTYVTGSVNLAGAKDTLGITGLMKKLKNLMPGWDNLEELPIIGRLFSTQDKEETEEYWKHGKDPVRKGRYWTLNNTPYTGGKIERYEPNWVNKLKSDYKYTDVMYGSKEEYFENWWLPTPTHPLSPIKHFFTDTKHWENKHYEDRPYPMTGGIAELREIPIIGGFTDATIGRVLKPREKMHEEYWNGDKLKEAPPIPIQEYDRAGRPPVSVGGNGGSWGVPGEDSNNETISYTTSSGSTKIMSLDKKENINFINNVLRNSSVRAVKGVSEITKGKSEYGAIKDTTILPIKPRGVVDVAQDTWTDTTEMGGFFGFSVESMTGEGIDATPRVQSSTDMTSYSRAFWDKNLGGFGGDISETFRRFVPKKKTAIKNAEQNPIRNTQPTWLPGSEYYIDFLHGDPYAKIAEGEYRLPGQGYEALHHMNDPMELNIGSSSIGKSKEDIVKHFLSIDDIEISQNANLKDILANGTSVHEKMEADWGKLGLAVASEVEVKDEEHGIIGYIDSILRDDSAKQGYAVVDYKTISNFGYEKLKTDGGKPENIAQVNFYMYKTGLDKAYLHYINRENPDAPTITFEYEYSEKLMKDIFRNLEESRQVIRDAIEANVVTRGDLYKPLDRYRILSDVAPYSNNYRYYDKMMSQMMLNEEEKEEVNLIRKQVSSEKDQLKFYPYKFKTANLKYEQVTVRDILDDGTILTQEYKDNPIKLAGVKFSTDVNSPEGKAAMEYLHSHIKIGKKIRIGYTADPLKQVEDDTYKSIKAVIFQGDKKLNLEMINKSIGEEKETDDSPASINARFTDGEILYGKMWEKAAHLDTFFNTKMMQVRSPIEQYKRRDLYGKDWQSWDSPIKDFLIPAIQTDASMGPIFATMAGAFIGSLFGKSKYGKLVGGAIGGLTMATVSMGVGIKRLMNEDGVYIPERRQKERNLNEYMDMLKYVKNIKLYEKYREMAIDEEDVDPATIINEEKSEGKKRKDYIKFLSKIKKDIHNNNIDYKQAIKLTKFTDVKDMKDLESKVNKTIETLTNYRQMKNISPLAAQAIMYYNESERTAQGYDSGEPIQNMLSALNRKERRYFMPFIEAPEEEREEILKLVPRYMKRALQSAYGMKSDKKPDINKYFEQHSLPGEDWAGWNEEVDLNDVKIKIVKHEGMDMSEFDLWPNDEARADYLDIPIPKIDYNNKSMAIKKHLQEVLSSTGLHNVQVTAYATNSPGINMNVNIENDRTEEIKNYVNSYGIE